MDRLKFRAYIKYSKSLHDIDSFYIDKLKKKVTIHFADCHTKSFKFEDIILMQCTGLKDVHGKLIYEGDLIKSPLNNNVIEIIRWNSSRTGFCAYSYQSSHGHDIFQFYLKELKSEIVGNIHQNKDLLKGFKNEN